MNIPDKNVLVISYTFPPAPGIGGRRWAKFAKYLTNDHQYSCFVITCKNNNTQVSPWFDDIKEYANNIHYFNNPYPAVINKKIYSFADKIAYRQKLLKLKLKHKGNYFDKTILLNDSFLQQIELIINKKNIKNIIVTAGPFYWLSLIIQLKKKFSQVNFIADFRDPWTNNKTSFGYSELSTSRLKYEKNLEKNVIENYDKIISVSPEMNSYFYSLTSKESQNKFICIPNGYDEDDFKNAPAAITNNNKLRFVFTGTLYNKTEDAIKSFSQALKKIKSEKPEAFNEMEFAFFGETPHHLAKYLKNINIVRLHGNIPLSEVYSEINKSQLCMLFLTDDLGYSMSTKFYEYLSQRKCIALFSEGGTTTRFIQNNKLGYSISQKNCKDEIIKIYTDWKKNKLIHNDTFDSSEFSIKQLTNKLIPILK